MKLPFLPEAASALASKVDALFVAVTLMIGIVALAVVVFIIVFALKYWYGVDVLCDWAPEPIQRCIRWCMEIA